jgi:hypothetical protein
LRDEATGVITSCGQRCLDSRLFRNAIGDQSLG